MCISFLVNMIKGKIYTLIKGIYITRINFMYSANTSGLQTFGITEELFSLSFSRKYSSFNGLDLSCSYSTTVGCLPSP